MSKQCEACETTHDPTPPNPLPCGCGAKGILGTNLEVTRMESHHTHVVLCNLHAAAPDLADALAPLVHAFSDHPGISDLDDEQPIHIPVTLGQWRKAHMALLKASKP